MEGSRFDPKFGRQVMAGVAGEPSFLVERPRVVKGKDGWNSERQRRETLARMFEKFDWTLNARHE